MPSEIVAIVEAVTTASAVSKPVLAGRANARLLSQIILDVQRAANVGGGTVWGANLPYEAAGDTKYCKQVGVDGATGRTVFTMTIPYAAWANHNTIVMQNGAVVDQGAGAGKFQVSDVGGFSVITLGTAAAVNDTIETFRVTPVALLTFATATTIFDKVLAQGCELLWWAADATATPSSTNIYATALGE
jgi:hypothetical protein